jgi:hypothetical protein
MPYIEPTEREVYDPQIDALVEQLTHFGANKHQMWVMLTMLFPN